MSDKILVLVTGVPKIISRIERYPNSNRIQYLYYKKEIKGKDGSETWEYKINMKSNFQLVPMTQEAYNTLLELRNRIKVERTIYRDHVRSHLTVDWEEKYGEFEQ